MKYYHVTLKDNLNSILKDGLIPQIGERSFDIGEKEKVVYLFHSIDDVEEALLNWLGDWYTDNYGIDTPLALLEVNLPDDFLIENSSVQYEKISKNVIPPQYISFLREE